MYALVEAIGYIAIGLIIWYAAGHRIENAATIGVVVVFIEYINKFFIPIRDLSAKYAVMQGAMAASERIFQLLDTDEYDGEIAEHDHRTAIPTSRFRRQRRAGDRASQACTSATAPSRCCAASISACRAARPSRSSARPAPASRR